MKKTYRDSVLHFLILIFITGCPVYSSYLQEDQRQQLLGVDVENVNSEQTPLLNINSSINIPGDRIESLKPVETTEAFVEAIKFCFPYMLSKVAISANGIWNGYLYGRIGGFALESEVVTLTYEFLIMGTAMGGLRASAILTGQLNGEDEISRKAMGNVNKSALMLTTIYSALTIPLFLKAGSIIERIGLVNEAAVIQEVQNYFDGFVWGVAPTLWLYGDEQFSLGLKDSKAPFIFGSLYAVISSVLGYPLTFGTWGMPECGVRGIGYAMSVGPLVAWLALRLYYNFEGKYKGLKLYNCTSIKGRSIKEYLMYALPLSLTNSISLITGAVGAQIIAGYSDEVASAYSASSAYFVQLEIALLGYSSAIGAFMANHDPRKFDKNEDQIYKVALQNGRRYAAASVITSLGVTGVLVIPTLIWQDQFIDFFAGTQPDPILQLAKTYIWFNVADAFFSTYGEALAATLHGLKDIAVPFVIDATSDALNLALVGMVAKYSGEPAALVAMGMIASFENAGVYTGRLYIIGKRIAARAVTAAVNAGNFMSRTWNKLTSCFQSNKPLEEAFA